MTTSDQEDEAFFVVDEEQMISEKAFHDFRFGKESKILSLCLVEKLEFSFSREALEFSTKSECNARESRLWRLAWKIDIFKHGDDSEFRAEVFLSNLKSPLLVKTVKSDCD